MFPSSALVHASVPMHPFNPMMQAYSISKLVQPEDDHKPLAQSLADALFGQVRGQDGNDNVAAVSKVCGLEI